jgi:glutamate/tyrosine decarboxylase-like PLP-dependent enzyme
VILSSRYKPMLRGIERADSITVDPHKWFYMPFSAGGILVREGDFLRQSFLVHPEYYMERIKAGEDGEAEEFDEFGRRIIPDPRGFHMGDKVNFFQYGVAGSRRFNALKVWMSLKLVGRKQFGEWVDNDIYLARLLAGLLRREPDFTLLGPNTLGVCNFRWEPRNPDGSPRFDDETTDRLNRQLQERIEREGDAWFSYTVLRGRTALRVNVENRRMRRENVERLVRVIRATADGILAEPGPLMT